MRAFARCSGVPMAANQSCTSEFRRPTLTEPGGARPRRCRCRQKWRRRAIRLAHHPKIAVRTPRPPRYGRFPASACGSIRNSSPCCHAGRWGCRSRTGERRHDAPGSEFRASEASATRPRQGPPLWSARRSEAQVPAAGQPGQPGGRFGDLIIGTDGSEYRCPGIEKPGHCDKSRSCVLNPHGIKNYLQGLAGPRRRPRPAILTMHLQRHQGS